jgi:hypothetical protein
VYSHSISFRSDNKPGDSNIIIIIIHPVDIDNNNQYERTSVFGQLLRCTLGNQVLSPRPITFPQPWWHTSQGERHKR